MSTAPIDSPKPVAPSMADHDALPAGTRFGEFEILSVLGVGGFGIVYLAHDHSLDRRVALKEYMPGALALRGDGAVITVRSKAHQETYAIGLRSFVNEARLLARFDHPSLVKVYRFWEDNATAYMVMPYLVGVTLRDTRRAMSQAPDEAWIRSVVGPILGALEQLHREGVYHRDIAPDNVLLQHDGPPVLLDFGAARRVISDRTQSLTAILKPNYAPIEQYAEMTQMRQGPWTDLYALGAVVHFMLMGVPPAPATARAVQEDAEPIGQRRVAGVSPRLMEIVAWMLALRPHQLPQSVAALRAVLDGGGPVPSSSAVTGAPTLQTEPASVEVTTLAITPYTPTEVMTTPHVAPSPAARSAGGFDSVAQPTPSAVEPRMAPADAPSVMSSATPAANDMPHAARSRSAAMRRSRGVLWIVAGVGAVVAVVLAMGVGGTGTGSESSGSASDAAAGAATAAPAARDTPRNTRQGQPAPDASSHAAAIAQPTVAASAALGSTAPQRRAAYPPPRARAPVAASVPALVLAGPKTAREACGNRVFIALAVCIDQRCEEPRYRSGQECVKILETKRARENR